MARLSKKAIVEALQATAGRVVEAAEKLGCSREHLHRRIRGNPALQEALDAARQRLIDLAEGELVKKVKRGNLTAIIFLLKTLGRDRGYSERVELEHTGRGEVRLAGVDVDQLRLKAERLLQWNAQRQTSRPDKPDGSPASRPDKPDGSRDGSNGSPAD